MDGQSEERETARPHLIPFPTSVTAVCLSLRLSTLRSSHLRFVPLREENGVSGVNDIRRTEVEREEGDRNCRWTLLTQLTKNPQYFSIIFNIGNH